MSPEELIDALEANLLAERAAVVALDSDLVSELCEEKDRLVLLLSEATVPRTLLARLGDLVALARYNCQLVAHARDSIRGAAAAAAGQVRTGTISSEDVPRRGVRVSVTG